MTRCERCGYDKDDYDQSKPCPMCGYAEPKLRTPPREDKGRIPRTLMLYGEEKGILQALKHVSNPNKHMEWVALKRIALAFSDVMNQHYSTMATSDFLYQLGQPFNGRKRMADGTYILVVYHILMRRIEEIERIERHLPPRR